MLYNWASRREPGTISEAWNFVFLPNKLSGNVMLVSRTFSERPGPSGVKDQLSGAPGDAPPMGMHIAQSATQDKAGWDLLLSLGSVRHHHLSPGGPLLYLALPLLCCSPVRPPRGSQSDFLIANLLSLALGPLHCTQEKSPGFLV